VRVNDRSVGAKWFTLVEKSNWMVMEYLVMVPPVVGPCNLEIRRQAQAHNAIVSVLYKQYLGLFEVIEMSQCVLWEGKVW